MPQRKVRHYSRKHVIVVADGESIAHYRNGYAGSPICRGAARHGRCELCGLSLYVEIRG